MLRAAEQPTADDALAGQRVLQLGVRESPCTRPKSDIWRIYLLGLHGHEVRDDFGGASGAFAATATPSAIVEELPPQVGPIERSQ
nr:hypothetical protein GCM10020063_075670 [Dactylosporangium thailandense]